jgi:hypothetical protein
MRYNFSCLLFDSKLFDADLYLKLDINNHIKPPLNNQQHQQQQQHQHHHHNHHNQQQQQQQHPLMNNTNAYNFSFGSVGLPPPPPLPMSNNNGNNNQLIFNSLQTNGQWSPQSMMAQLSAHLFGTYSINAKDYAAIKSNMPQTSVGLLEVLPLNFKCVSSNGSTIEKNNSKADSSLYVLPNYFSIFGNDSATTPASAPELTKTNKSNDNKVKNSEASPASDTDNDDQGKTDTENEASGNEGAISTPTDDNNKKEVPMLNHPIDTSVFNSIFTFHPLQHLVIERMEPCSRHSVVLDFGFVVALTDIMIPACSELASISVDYWLHK